MYPIERHRTASRPDEDAVLSLAPLQDLVSSRACAAAGGATQKDAIFRQLASSAGAGCDAFDPTVDRNHSPRDGLLSRGATLER
jgi:hypothetical protein